MLAIPNSEYTRRIKRFQENIRAAGLDAALVHANEADFANVRYLSEYWPTFEAAGVFVPAEGSPVLIIGPERRLRPDFVRIPVDGMDPVGVAVLAGIITLTPGTLSVDTVDDGRSLLVHALDVANPAALVETIRARYEAPLRAIFPGEAPAP